MKQKHLILIFLFIFSGCGSKPSSQSKFVISLGALLSATFTGGAILRITDTTTGDYKDVEVVPPYVVLVPFGKWDFHFVGFPGPAAWVGAPKCGATMAVTLAAPEETVIIDANNGACSAEPFASIISSKSGSVTWDMTKSWDVNLTWGP
jgi:hypothetical protein